MDMTRFLFLTILLCSIKVADCQELTSEQLEYDGLTRTYLKYIPAGFDGNNSLPLVMNFHGGTDNGNAQLNIADMRALADQDQFILVYPDAYPEPLEGETNWQVVVSGDLPFTVPTAHDDIGFVDVLIDAMHAEHGIDLNRVYAMGYSNGGGFAFDLACRLNERIAAIGVVARTMYIESYESCNVTHPTAVMTILGTADYISNYDGITYEGTLYYASADDSHDLWLDANGIPGEPVQTAVPDISSNDGSTADLITWESLDECVAVEHYRINGGGHDWPGTFGNMDIVAHEVIWDFVKQYGLSGHLDCTTNAILPSGETQSDDLLLYPLPASNHLNVTVPGVGPWHCALINAQGQAIRRMQSSFSQLTIDCSDLKTGMYFIQATVPNGQSYTSQVLIER